MNHLNALTILVMDDDAKFASVLALMIEVLGGQVHTVSDPFLFRESYIRLKPDIVLMDIVMPGIDGIELTQWIARTEVSAKVILISGYNPSYSTAAKILAEAQGKLFITCLKKPFKFDDLQKAFEKLETL